MGKREGYFHFRLFAPRCLGAADYRDRADSSSVYQENIEFERQHKRNGAGLLNIFSNPLSEDY
jgi:hypothetical protein